MPDDSAILSSQEPVTSQATAQETWEWKRSGDYVQGAIHGQGQIHGTMDRVAWAAERRRVEYCRSISENRSLRQKAFDMAIDTFGLGLRMTGLAALGERNAKAISISTASAVFPALPDSLHGLRILYIADPHFDCIDGFTEKVIERVRGLHCDLLIAGGDYRYGNDCQFTETHTIDALAQLKDAVQVDLGSYAILGNHDCADMAPSIEQAGYDLLVNETAVIPVGDSTIALTGLDDVHAYPTQSALDALARGGLVPADFSVALVHSPELADEAVEAGHNLYLCGHTHGGQICLPNGRPLIVPLHCNHELATGQWKRGAMHGYTSRGVGTSTLPVRFNCPPEIVALTLKKS